MAGGVGTIAIHIVSKHGQAIAGMQKTGAAAKRMGSTFGGIGKTLGGFATKMIGIGSAIGLAWKALSTFNDVIREMDAAGKMSDRIGITTEALTSLQHAADRTGAGTDTLNAGLQTMAKRLGEAARGAGAAKPALEFLNLSAAELVKLSPDKAFVRIAEAISKVRDQQQRAALTANLFSKGNMQLLNTLQLGEKGLASYAAEAKKLGKTFSDEDAKSAAAYTDAMDDLKLAFRGFMVEVVPDIIEELMPAIQSLTDSLVTLLGWVDVARRAGGKLKEMFGGFVWLIPGGGFADIFGDTEAGMKKTGAAADRAGKSIADMGNQMADTSGLDAQTDSANDLADALGDVADGQRDVADTKPEAEREVPRAGGGVNMVRPKAGAAAAAAAAAMSPMEKYLAKQEAANKEQLRLQAQQAKDTAATRAATEELVIKFTDSEGDTIKIVQGSIAP